MSVVHLHLGQLLHLRQTKRTVFSTESEHHAHFRRFWDRVDLSIAESVLPFMFARKATLTEQRKRYRVARTERALFNGVAALECVSDIYPEDEPGLTPEMKAREFPIAERRTLGQRILLCLGSLKEIAAKAALTAAIARSWWFVSCKTTRGSDEPRGVFFHFPSLAAGLLRPVGKFVHAVNLAEPPGAAPHGVLWALLQLHPDGAVLTLEPRIWSEVINELKDVLVKRNARKSAEAAAEAAKQKRKLTQERIGGNSPRGKFLA
eukprot:Polyplicarium_translucidae@DN2672_c0_g1_i2.p1